MLLESVQQCQRAQCRCRRLAAVACLQTRDLLLRPSACAGELVPVSVKEGDKVLLPEYGGTVVKLQEKE